MDQVQRICFVNSFIYNIYHPETQGSVGGAEIQLYYIIEELKITSKYDIYVFGMRPEASDIKQKDTITFWNVRAWTVPLLGAMNFMKFFWSLYKINADVYTIRTASAHVGYVALFCRLFRKKCIYMVASMIDVDGRYVKESSWFSGRSFLYGLHNSQIIAQNQEQVDLLKHNYNLNAALMYNGIALPVLEQSALEKNCILWVGRADVNKQPLVFANLAKAFPNEQFVLITTLNDKAVIDKVYAATKEVSNLTIFENMPFFETDTFYKRAKVLVNTSGYEGFPNTFLHAGAYYCPSLSLNVNPDGILTKYEIGWCAEGNEDSLRDFLQIALTDEPLRKMYGMNARKYVESNHDIKKNINTFINVL